MGLFDTIKFPRPIKCVKCGKEHKSTQTKMFENLMLTYKVGDSLPKYIITGVLVETIYCDHDEKQESSFDQEVYLAVWHNILIDICESYDEAEKKVNNFSIGDLFLLYRNILSERNKYRYKFHAIKNWIEKYLEYVKLSKEEVEKLLNQDTSFANFHMKCFAKEINSSDDPFGDYLKKINNIKNYDYDFFGF
ncbi:MAG: hypothetical protein ACP6IY_12385 [Promethearchaeia archaeon]